MYLYAIYYQVSYNEINTRSYGYDDVSLSREGHLVGEKHHMRCLDLLFTAREGFFYSFFLHMHLLHINDVIAHHDTTVGRLQLEYDLIAQTLGRDAYTLHLLSTEGIVPAKAARLVRRCIDRILKSSLKQRQRTLLVNSASRAKHTDSKEAKGSTCLRGTSTHQDKTIHVVGVDDEVFALLGLERDYLRRITAFTFN